MKVLDELIKEIFDNYDGEPVDRYLESECKKLGYPEWASDFLIRYWTITESYGHGIPLKVSLGCKALRDYFSQEYIDYMCNKSNKGLVNEK